MAGGTYLSSEQDPGTRLLANIPVAERNGWEQQVAQALHLIQKASATNASTLEGASLCAADFFAAIVASDGLVGFCKFAAIRMMQAVNHVQCYSGMHFTFLSPTAPGDLNPDQLEQQYEAGTLDTLTHSLSHTRAVPSVELCREITAQELPVILLSLLVMRMHGCHAELLALTFLLQRAADHVNALFQQLGGLGGLSAEDWEGSYHMEVYQAMLTVLPLKEEGTPAHRFAVSNRESASLRFLEVCPGRIRPCVSRATAVAVDSVQEPGRGREALRLAIMTYQMGDQQQHDYASAFGRWLQAWLILQGAGGKPRFTIGTVRALVAEAKVHEDRLKRWGMQHVLEKRIGEFVARVKWFLKKRKHAPAATRYSVEEADDDLLSDNCSDAGPSAAAAAPSPGSGASPSGELQQTLPWAQGELKLCAACDMGSYASSLKKCSACRTVFYCSSECQVKHWKAGHRQECKRLVALAAGAARGSREAPSPANMGHGKAASES